MVNAAVVLTDLRAPPGNQLEALSGDRRGQHSIRVNNQWRICCMDPGRADCRSSR
jgi:proteic killer suppression protein